MEDDLKKSGFVNRTLKPHQEEGVQWLLQRFRDDDQRGCILTDEMGLGKTTQSLALLALTQVKGQPSLIVSPLSILNNWLSELALFLPHLEVVKYHGDLEARLEQKKKKQFDVVVTTYEMVMSDMSHFSAYTWNIAIFDEGHRLKNPEAKATTLLRDLTTSFTLMLSGTPVQNNLRELYSLLCFVDPTEFPLVDITEFCDRYGDESLTSELHGLLRPYVLRRTKHQVLSDLPPINECIVTVALTETQKRVYKGCLVKDRSALNPNTPSSSLNNTLMQLRKCSNHPYMFEGIEPQPFVLGEHLVRSSGKLTALDQILRYCAINSHRVLLFSQFSLTLDILQDYLYLRGYSYERLDGSVRAEERFNAISNFSSQDTFCFLLSTRAGGVGLNLTAADTVVFYDGDWNPQNDIQATARAHRIGQMKPVKVIRLVSEHTIDEIMLKRMEHKLKLTKRVIAEGEFSGMENGVEDAKTLSDMLVYGLQHLLDEDDVGTSTSVSSSIDIGKVLGETDSHGNWVFGARSKKEGDAELMDNKLDVSSAQGDMYEFEGVNYRKKVSRGRRALESLIEAEEAERAMALGWGKSGEIAAAALTSEERAAWLSELEEKERERAAAEAARRSVQRSVRLEAQRRKWLEAGYTTAALPVTPDDEVNDPSVSRDTSPRDLVYVTGNVLKPQAPRAIVVHCCDSSGKWGRGGLFSGISAISDGPMVQYQLAKDMGDLKLGQCHVMELSPGVKLALVMAMRRGPTVMKLDFKMLERSFRCLSGLCRDDNLSVHFPRFGVSPSDWYTIERLTRKYFAGCGVETYIYYYKRGVVPRSTGSVTPTSAKKHKPNPSSAVPTSSSATPSSNGSSSTGFLLEADGHLPNCLNGMQLFLEGDIEKTERSVLTRYIIAAGGAISSTISDHVTHVVSRDSSLLCRQEIMTPETLASLFRG